MEQINPVWLAEGIESCRKKGYDLDRLTVNWESRELRYANSDSVCYSQQHAIKEDLVTMAKTEDLEDISPYMNNLPSGNKNDLRRSILKESERLIGIAKEVGQFISTKEWGSFGVRTKKQSGESIVFYDESKKRVVKFRDPFAYAALKHENPYTVLFEHYAHNRYFSNVGYKFLGVSQDYVSKGVRLVYEQPFIDTLERPSKAEIHAWFVARGFCLTKDGYFYSDGNVSFTDVWADNCLKDSDGNLCFIDPIVRFEEEPQKVLGIWMK